MGINVERKKSSRREIERCGDWRLGEERIRGEGGEKLKGIDEGRSGVMGGGREGRKPTDLGYVHRKS